MRHAAATLALDPLDAQRCTDGLCPKDGALTILRPTSLADALALRADHPQALVVAGGTAVMPELSRGLEVGDLLDLSRVAGLREVGELTAGVLTLGALVTYTQAAEELAEPLAGLAAAARTVASRQIRNRATLVGALVLGDPSADALAALGAGGAEVEVASAARGVRRVAADAFVTAPGACDLAADELVTALHVPVDDGPTAYAKVGARNAMARAICGVAVALHPAGRSVTCCVVGAAPTAIRPLAAEAIASETWQAGATPDAAGFGALVAEAVAPHDDARASAAYRRRAAGVLARRALGRAFTSLAVPA